MIKLIVIGVLVPNCFGRLGLFKVSNLCLGLIPLKAKFVY
jgi:hypothetical protein